MKFNVGDYVTRNSYNNDIVFVILSIDEGEVILKGVSVRLIANSPIDDLIKYDAGIDDDFGKRVIIESPFTENNRCEFFYLPAKVLHLDGDGDYLKKCLEFYKNNRIMAFGKVISEENMYKDVLGYLREYKPDILVITGHDAYVKKNDNINDLINYKNTLNFIKTVKEARKYEKSHEKLVIIAGACQSDYEELIKSGADFASSPKRVNIHALDPAIIATAVSLTEKNKEINIVDLLEKTKYGKDGMGGLKVNGLMYVGYPR